MRIRLKRTLVAPVALDRRGAPSPPLRPAPVIQAGTHPSEGVSGGAGVLTAEIWLWSFCLAAGLAEDDLLPGNRGDRVVTCAGQSKTRHNTP